METAPSTWLVESAVSVQRSSALFWLHAIRWAMSAVYAGCNSLCCLAPQAHAYLHAHNLLNNGVLHKASAQRSRMEGQRELSISSWPCSIKIQTLLGLLQWLHKHLQDIEQLVNLCSPCLQLAVNDSKGVFTEADAWSAREL